MTKTTVIYYLSPFWLLIVCLFIYLFISAGFDWDSSLSRIQLEGLLEN